LQVFVAAAENMSDPRGSNGQPTDARSMPEPRNRATVTTGGQRRDLTVLVSSIRGFDAMADTIAPTDLIQLLNTYLARLGTAVSAHAGLPNRYPGDLVMALYGVSHADHALGACRTAIDMAREFHQLRTEWAEQHLPPLEINIGISTGAMVMANIDAGSCVDVSVIGSAVNLGVRLESLNRTYGTHILLSEATYRGVADAFPNSREIDVVQIVSRPELIRVYELMLAEDYPNLDWLAEFSRGYELFRADLRPQARAVFQRLAERVNDPVSRHYLERCLVPRRRRGD